KGCMLSRSESRQSLLTRIPKTIQHSIRPNQQRIATNGRRSQRLPKMLTARQLLVFAACTNYGRHSFPTDEIDLVTRGDWARRKPSTEPVLPSQLPGLGVQTRQNP